MDLAGDILFAAKTASYQLADHAHALLRPAQGACHIIAVRIGNLRAHIDFHTPIGGGPGDATFWLHKGMVGHLGMESVLQDYVCFGESLLDIALTHFNVLK